jgi:hypothetical protein
MQTFSLLCCFALFFLLPHHLLAGSSDPLRAPEPVAAQTKQVSIAPHPSAEISDIHDIYGPVPLPEPPPYWQYCLGILLITAAGALLFVMYRFKRDQENGTNTNPAVQARADLQRAKKIRGETGDLLRYCDDVATILRTYVEQVSGYRISSRTTLESLRELEKSEVHHPFTGKETLDLLRRCFSQCDMVKFARFSPDKVEIEHIGTLAESFVSTTSTGENA